MTSDRDEPTNGQTGITCAQIRTEAEMANRIIEFLLAADKICEQLHEPVLHYFIGMANIEACEVNARLTTRSSEVCRAK